MSQQLLLPTDPQFVFRLTFEMWHTNPTTAVSSWERYGKIHYYSSDDAGQPPKVMTQQIWDFINRRSYTGSQIRPVVKRYVLHADISKDFFNGKVGTPPVASTP